MSTRRAAPLILMALAAAALASDPVIGPPLGNTRYRGDITNGPQGDDTDAFAGPFLTGERITVKVVSKFQSPLVPRLSVRRPDGSTPPLEPRLRKGGKTLVVAGLVCDLTGNWEVEVGSEIRTQGNYTLTTNVKPMRTVRIDALALGGDDPATATLELPGMALARLDLTISWGKSDAPVRLLGLTAPDGHEVLRDGVPLVGAAKITAGAVRLRKALLDGGLGMYRLTFGVDSGTTTARVSYRVRPTARPRTRGVFKLDSAEPYLAPSAVTLRGVPGLRVTLDGRNFAYPGMPRVLFDGVPAIIDERDEFGNTLRVIPPLGPDDADVAVTVVNPDGQAFTRSDYFHYVAPPTVDALLGTDGAPVLGGSTAGGRVLRMTGTYFEPGLRVRFGTASVSTLLLDDGLIEFVLPPHAPGVVSVVAFDVFTHEASAPTLFTYKAPPAPSAAPYSPAVVAAGAPTFVLLGGADFELGDEVLVDGVPAATTYGTPGLIGFTTPALGAGVHDVAVRDQFGSVGTAPTLRAKEPAVITSATVTGGPLLGAAGVPHRGGSTLTIDGENFDATDAVAIGGAAASVLTSTGTRLTVRVPPGVSGDADLEITDVPGRTTTASAVVHFMGYLDRTSSATPGKSTTDDLSALRGALGDLAADGGAQDLALVSFESSPGSRQTRTRVFENDGAGALSDVTSSGFPTAQAGDFDSPALTIGDLDGANGPDLLIAWVPDEYDYQSGELRAFANGGSGSFTRRTAWEPPSIYTAEVRAQDQNGRPHTVFDALLPQGVATSLAIGDLDKDGDQDVVLGRDHYEYRFVSIDPSVVDFSGATPYVSSSDAANNALSRYAYTPATRLLVNRISTGGGLEDETESRFPSAGDSDSTPLPAFHAQDVAIGDLDGDTWPDIVVTWDDPLTVTATGLSPYTSADTARVATRVLMNDGTGAFTDQTANVLPAASSPEYLQAHRVRVADLDGDGDLDIVLLHRSDLNAFQSSPSFVRHALRILRNDGASATPRFSNVTTTALPAIGIDGSNENYRGGALAVADVNGDGYLDILVGATTDIPTAQDGTRLAATRLLLGDGALHFTDATAFLPTTAQDSGEADDLLLGDLDGGDDPSLVLVTESAPAHSPGGEWLRVLEWLR